MDFACKLLWTYPCLSQRSPHFVKTYGRGPGQVLSAEATTSSEWPVPYTAAVSIQFTPRSRARCMAAINALSAWAPQQNSQPEPPMAQAPKPMGVMNKSELPRRFVFMSGLDSVFVFSVFIGQTFRNQWIFRCFLLQRAAVSLCSDVIQLGVACITPSDWIVSGDKLP